MRARSVFAVLLVSWVMVLGRPEARAASDLNLELEAQCRASTACRNATGLKDAIDKASAEYEAVKARIVEFYNSPSKGKALTDAEYLATPIEERQPKIDSCLVRLGKDQADFCHQRNMTEAEFAAWDRKAHPVTAMGPVRAESVASGIYEDDYQLNKEFGENCGSPEAARLNAETCHRLIERLNRLEDNVALYNKDADGFRKHHPKALSLLSTETAEKQHFKRTPRGMWDEVYQTYDLFPLSAQATPAPSPPVIPALASSLTPFDTMACDRAFVDGYRGRPGDPDDALSQLKAILRAKNYDIADTEKLKDSIAEFENNIRTDYYQQIQDRYAICYMKALLAKKGAPQSGILRRGGDTGVAALQDSIKQSAQWENDRPAREARARAEFDAAMIRKREEIAENQRLEALRREKAARDSAAFDSFLSVVGTIASAYLDTELAQAAAAASTPAYAGAYQPPPSYGSGAGVSNGSQFQRGGTVTAAPAGPAGEPAKQDATGCVRVVDPKTIGVKSNFSWVIKNSCGFSVTVFWNGTSTGVGPNGYSLFSGGQTTRLRATRN